MRSAVVKIYFDRKGQAKRAVLLLSSGNKERDRLSLNHCMKLVIPMPRLGTQRSGEVWRKLIISGDMDIG